MANLSKNTYHKTAPRGKTRSFVVDNGVQIYAGALVGIDASGYLDIMADTAGHKFIGVALEDALGNTSATPPTECRVNVEGMTPAADMLAASGQFGTPKVLDESHSPTDRLIALIGRDPDWAPPAG